MSTPDVCSLCGGHGHVMWVFGRKRRRAPCFFCDGTGENVVGKFLAEREKADVSREIWGVVRLADGTWPEKPLIETFRYTRGEAELQMKALKAAPGFFWYRLAQFREVESPDSVKFEEVVDERG